MEGTASPRRRGGHLWQLIVGLLVSAVCLWVAFPRDPRAWHDVQAAFVQADYRALPLMFGCLIGFYLLKAWRWRLLLKPVGDFHSLTQLLPAVMIGFAFNNLLPAHLGDVYRSFVFARRQRVTLTAALSSVVLERVFDIIAVLLLLGGGLAFVQGLNPSVHQTAVVFAAIAGALVLGALVFVFWTQPFVRLTEAVLARLPLVPVQLRTYATGTLEAAATGLASLKSPRLLTGIFASSMGQWLLNAATAHLALWSFGVHVTPAESCLVIGVTAFGVTVPSSPGYFGVIQVCFWTVLQAFGHNQPTVFAASVYYHLSQYIPVTLVGLYYFWTAGLRMQDVADQAQPATDAPSSPRMDGGQPVPPTR